ncbi:MAG: enoyl-CoA hydratase/isomerase family protein [Chloroflexi bacterium]|nr:enoyl-CoA hydratase/isomerase family protein [Chloroflexota bacterium]
MTYETITIEKKDGIAILTLNRPEVLNAWNPLMAEEASNAIESMDSDDDVQVLIITGAGRAFSSGADVSRLKEMAENEVPLLETTFGRVLTGKTSLLTAVENIRKLSKPVIAAIHGVAAGAGLSVALACDIRISTNDARFSMAFVKRGLIPDLGGTYLLPRLVGPGIAAKLIFTGDVIDAKEADKIGMVDELVPPEELMSRTEELAQKIAQNPPLAVRTAKKALYKGMNETDLRSQMDYEIFIQGTLMRTEDFLEGVNSFFEKREPKFKGR